MSAAAADKGKDYMSMDADGLRSVRNFFYSSLNQSAIKEAAALRSNKELAPFAEIYAARAQCAINPDVVYKSIGAGATTGLQAVKQLAMYKSATEDGKELVVQQVQEWLQSEMLKKDDTLQIIAAHIFIEENKHKEALKVLANPGENLEKLALCVQIYLKIDRVDLAAKHVKLMQDIDDDDTLTQLAQSWLMITQGGDKVTEASFLLQELIEKFGPSPRVLNGLAVCQIHLRNYAQAFQHLKQARDLAVQNKEPVAAETFVNSIVCLQHLRKGQDVLEKITAELAAAAPGHSYLKKQQEMSVVFDTQAQLYAQKVKGGVAERKSA